MSNDRSHRLLRAAALALEDGRDPFSTDFLVDHDVTGDECVWLSHKMASIIMGFISIEADMQERLAHTGQAALEEYGITQWWAHYSNRST